MVGNIEKGVIPMELEQCDWENNSICMYELMKKTENKGGKNNV